jgi:hypothetical protein
MKLQLTKNENGFKRPRKPIDHFKQCPACGDKDLIILDPDVLCSKYDWDSTAWHVSVGGMDCLKSAASEFEAGSRRSKLKAVTQKAVDQVTPETVDQIQEFRKEIS